MYAHRQSALALIASLACTLLLPSGAPANELWPQRTVRIVVPLPAGTATDVAIRACAERLTARWGKPVVVENRQGGDGIPAVMNVLGARDNHTFLLSFAGVITINPLIHEKLPYDPQRDLVPIVSIIDNFIAIAASKTLQVNTVAEFIAAARTQPGKLNWAATPGIPQYVFEAIQKSASIDIARAPYREFGPALQDLGEGRIQAAASGLPIFMSQVNAGRAKILLVTNRQRSPMVPDVPTAAEAGYPELTFEGVVGLYGTPEMPPALRDRIAADFAAAADDTALASRIAGMGSVLRIGMPADFAAAIEDQRQKIAAIAASKKPTQ
jgi:tripartite-type tricarboxylate transporter receptor subunit TctC